MRPLLNRRLRKQKKLYEEATKLEGEPRADKFYDAGKLFDKAGKNWVSSYLELDSMFWAGESYFFSEDYNKAEDRYVKLLKEYPRNQVPGSCRQTAHGNRELLATVSGPILSCELH
jgi:TolA-binding protein